MASVWPTLSRRRFRSPGAKTGGYEAERNIDAWMRLTLPPAAGRSDRGHGVRFAP